VEFLAIAKSVNTVLPVVPAEEKCIVKGAMPGSWDSVNFAIKLCILLRIASMAN
jgi:hypothetical protein